MKKIFLIVPTLSLGGQEKIAVTTVEILKGSYETILVVFNDTDMAYSPPCKVINIDIPAHSNKIMKIVNVIKRSYALYKLKKQHRPCASISFGTTANFTNSFSGQWEKSFLSLHGYGSATKNVIFLILYFLCNKIFCVSDGIKNKMRKIYNICEDKFVTLHNPYNLQDILDRGQEKVSDYMFSQNTIVSCGRLDEVKNYPRLIKAFFLVAEQIHDAQLLIIGEGREREKLMKLIKKYNLEKKVTLLGFRSNPFAYLAKSKLYALSSFNEGLPNALIEGMCFLPVISVDCKTGPREILSTKSIETIAIDVEDADYGVLVPPAREQIFCEDITTDDKILAKGIITLLTDPQKMEVYKIKANERVKDFSCEAFRKRLLKYIEREKASQSRADSQITF